jgi:hypothetical protein
MTAIQRIPSYLSKLELRMAAVPADPFSATPSVEICTAHRCFDHYRTFNRIRRYFSEITMRITKASQIKRIFTQPLSREDCKSYFILITAQPPFGRSSGTLTAQHALPVQ